jgi:hypothetical protein
VRFLLIERLDNFSLKLLFFVQMTKKDLTILLRLSCLFLNAVNVSKCFDKNIMKIVINSYTTIHNNTTLL